jgi:hypothetical protein
VLPSIKEAYGRSPVVVAREFIESEDENARQRRLAVRRSLLSDNSEEVIRRVIGQSFESPLVQTRLLRFAPLAKGWSLYKRLVNERTRPVYSVPPTRILKLPEGSAEGLKAAEDRYRDLCMETCLNERMKAACHMAVGENHAFTYTRYVEQLGKIKISLIHADNMRVVPHPDDPLEAIAYIYGKRVWVNGEYRTWYVCWDSVYTFQFNEQFQVVPFTPAEAASPIRRHEMPRMPFVAIHAHERVDNYWSVTEGDDAVAADASTKLMGLLGLRNLKARGFRQLHAAGDISGIPKGQIMDEESVFFTGPETSVNTLDTQSDSAHYLAMLDHVKLDAAANQGVSRSRLNQDGTPDSASDTGLHEQRAEVVQMMYAAELEQFEVLRMVAAEAGQELPANARVDVDFGEIEFRADPKGTIELWKELRSMGLMNTLDMIKRMNPEVRSDDDAESEFLRNIKVESWRVKEMRALQMNADMEPDMPGQNAQANGALGPLTRDGKITGDDAERMSREGSGSEVYADE